MTPAASHRIPESHDGLTGRGRQAWAVESTVATPGGESASPYHRAMPRRLVSPTLVGRVTELDAIVRALDTAVAGAPIHQLIAGEAGVGKSRLVLEAAAMASGRGMRVLQGGCADIGDGGVPYGPIVEALRTLTRALEPDELETVLGAARPEIARLVPVARPGRRRSDRRRRPNRTRRVSSTRCSASCSGCRRSPRSCSSSRTSIGPIRRPARPSRSSSGTCAPTGSCW